MVLHELAHVKRRDHLVNLLQAAVETLLFYHPAVWWISGRVRQEREHCCDDLAIDLCGDRHAYVRALADMADLRSVGPRLALAANGGSLVTRIRRLVDVDAPVRRVSARWWTGAAAVTVAAVALVGQIVILGLTPVLSPKSQRSATLNPLLFLRHWMQRPVRQMV